MKWQSDRIFEMFHIVFGFDKTVPYRSIPLSMFSVTTIFHDDVDISIATAIFPIASFQIEPSTILFKLVDIKSMELCCVCAA